MPAILDPQYIFNYIDFITRLFLLTQAIETRVIGFTYDFPKFGKSAPQIRSRSCFSGC